MSIPTIATFCLSFGRSLNFSDSRGTATEYEQAVEQVAQKAPPVTHGQPATERVLAERKEKPHG